MAGNTGLWPTLLATWLNLTPVPPPTPAPAAGEPPPPVVAWTPRRT